MKTIIRALSGALLSAVLLAVFVPSAAWTKAVGFVGDIVGSQLASDIDIASTGYINGDVGPFISLASGALTANRTHLATAAADYVLPACETANIGQWVTVIVQDISEVVVLQPATGDTINPAGAVIDQNHEMDSSGAATGDGDFVTLVCVTADMWFSTAIGGAWVDGGAS